MTGMIQKKKDNVNVVAKNRIVIYLFIFLFGCMIEIFHNVFFVLLYNLIKYYEILLDIFYVQLSIQLKMPTKMNGQKKNGAGSWEQVLGTNILSLIRS